MAGEREVMEVDVLFVGGGPAGLCGAIRYMDLVDAHNSAIDAGQKQGAKITEPMVAVVEKGVEAGMHSLSGAVVDPRAFRELFPDFDTRDDVPHEGRVERESVFFLTEHERIKFPIVPPPLRNHGNYIFSLGRLTRWLAQIAEGRGVNVFAGFAGAELLYEDNRVVGVRTGDKGIDKDGSRRANFEPGIDLRAKVTVLCEGVRGSLTKKLIARHHLDEGRNPQIYGVGVKEVLEVPAGRFQPGTVIHTMGFPCDFETYGGTWLYSMRDNRVSLGLVIGLDYKNPWLDPHLELQRWKLHPLMKDLLDGAKVEGYGAKAMPLGGWFSIPRTVVDGCLIAGDSASFLNPPRLKGVHMAAKTGMLAAETAFEAVVAGDSSVAKLAAYERAIDSSWVKTELWPERNFHQGFKRGLFFGLVNAGAAIVTKGRGFGIFNRLKAESDHEGLYTVKEMKSRDPLADSRAIDVPLDGKFTLDRLTDLYLSGTMHEEHQPAHLIVPDRDLCATRCYEEFRNPCTRFCPAFVYEIETNEATGQRALKLNPSNCVHCKTCDIKDPYENITWVPPEGGGGPKYSMM